MNALKRRWKLLPLVALWWSSPTALAAARATAAQFGDADQDRRHVRLSGRVRLVRQPGPRRRRHRDGAVRGWQARRIRTSRVTAGRAASINGHPLKLVGVGCSNDKRRHRDQGDEAAHGAAAARDIMIGPLSGDESIAVANYAKQHPTKTFVDGAAGAQDTTLKVRAPNFFRFNGDGAMWNAGLGDIAYNKLGWKTAAVVADDYSFALDVGRRLHRRVLRSRRQGHEAGVPAAEHDRLLVVRAADADERRRHVRGSRRRRADPVPEGLRAGARADRREEVHRQPVLGHPGEFQQLGTRVVGRLRRRRRHGRRPGDARRRRPTTPRSARSSRRSRRSAQPLRRRRRRSRTATTSTRGACSRGSRRSVATSRAARRSSRPRSRR